jgi:predicted  nucleic acid-binding Zn-ribbon protein
MFGGSASLSPASVDALHALIELITHKDAAKQVLDRLITERKKNEAHLKEMSERNEKTVKVEAENAKKLKEVADLKDEYEPKWRSLVEREQALRDNMAAFRGEVEQHRAEVKADKAAHDQREQILAQHEFNISSQAREATRKMEQADARLAAVEQREAKIRAAFE